MNQTTKTADTPPATLRSHNVAQTHRLGALLGALLEPGDVVLLQGDLGAGKTVFTQGIAAGLEIEGTVNSPTFTLLKEYFGRLPLYHFDLYRIESPDEVESLGFEDYFDSDGVSVVEWAERGESPDAPDDPDATVVASPWPTDWLRVALTPIAGEREGRELAVTAQGSRGNALLTAFIRTAASEQTQESAAERMVAEEVADAAGD